MAAWSAGDFNADGFVDGLDFIIWNDNKFTSSDQAGSNALLTGRPVRLVDTGLRETDERTKRRLFTGTDDTESWLPLGGPVV